MQSPKRNYQTLRYSQYLKRMLNLVVLYDGCDWDLTIQYILFNVRGASGFERRHPFRVDVLVAASGTPCHKEAHEGWIEWVMALVHKHMLETQQQEAKMWALTFLKPPQQYVPVCLNDMEVHFEN